MNGVLRPADSQSAFVRSCGKAVRSAERRQGCHFPVFPYETQATGARRGRRRKECGAAPVFSVWIRRSRLTDSGKSAAVVLHGPYDAAVQPSERIEIELQPVPPQSRMPGRVPDQVGVAGDPAAIVDAVASTDCAAVRRQVFHLILNLAA